MKIYQKSVYEFSGKNSFFFFWKSRSSKRHVVWHWTVPKWCVVYLQNGSVIVYERRVVLRPEWQLINVINDMSFFAGNWQLLTGETTCHFLPVKSKMTCRFPASSSLNFDFTDPNVNPYTQWPTRFKIHHPNTVLTRSNRKISINPMTLWFMISNYTKKFQNWKTQYHVPKRPYTLFFIVFENSTLTSR